MKTTKTIQLCKITVLSSYEMMPQQSKQEKSTNVSRKSLFSDQTWENRNQAGKETTKGLTQPGQMQSCSTAICQSPATCMKPFQFSHVFTLKKMVSRDSTIDLECVPRLLSVHS